MLEVYEKEETKNDKKEVETGLSKRLSNRVSRHIISQTEDRQVNARMGLSFLGAIGWHIPVPTVLGALIGRWLDKNYPYGNVSWSLNLLLLGLGIGMFSTWRWLQKEGIERAKKEQNTRNDKIAQMNSDLTQELPMTDKIIGEDVLDD